MSARETLAALAATARRGLPWLVALAILTVLVREIRLEPLRDAFRHGAYLALAAYIVLETLLALPADAFAAREALAAAGVRRPWREVLQARGASYLLGLVSYMAGQGGMGWYLARTGVPVGRSAGAVLLLMITNGMVMVVLGAAGLGTALTRGALAGAPRELLFLTIAAALAGTVAYLGVIAARRGGPPAIASSHRSSRRGVAGHLPRFRGSPPPHAAADHSPLGSVSDLGDRRAVLSTWCGAESGRAAWWRRCRRPRRSGNDPGTAGAVLQPLGDGAPTSDSRAAAVLAFSLVHHVAGLIVQGGIGLACLIPLRRTLRRGEA